MSGSARRTRLAGQLRRGVVARNAAGPARISPCRTRRRALQAIATGNQDIGPNVSSVLSNRPQVRYAADLGPRAPLGGSVLGSVAFVSLMGNVVTPEGRGRAHSCGLRRAATEARCF